MIDNSRGLSKTSALRREIRRKFREFGIGGTLKLAVRKLMRDIRKLQLFKKQNLHPFDLKYGTDTSGIIKPEAMDIPNEKMAHANRYQTAIVEVFLDILNSLSISYEEFLFVDLGSGKGRSLLLASQYPFKRIIGVELSETLHMIARRNIQIYKDKLQQCYKIESVCEDAASFTILNENIIFYLFNPFDEHVIREVLSNIEDAIHKFHRNIYIAYLKPVHRDVFDRASFLKINKETDRYVIYQSKQIT